MIGSFPVITWLAILGSLILLGAILHDAFEVMLLPRRVKSRTRIVRYFFRSTWSVWSWLGSRIPGDERRHGFLGLYGPLSLVLLLIVWAAGLIIGFGTLFWAINRAQHQTGTWLNQAYFSGVTFFTLGYGDIVPRTPFGKVLSVLEAGTGLGFIAMVIGYLPVLYQVFSRREALVILLDAVAGSPPNAATMLSRYSDGRSMEALDEFLLRWQQWAAELLESQLSYPMLAYYRSQHENQSWLAALTTVMDVSVLIMVGFRGVRTFHAQITFATARLAVIEMGRVLGAGPKPIVDDRLSGERFSELKATLVRAELAFVEEDEAREHLAAFRDTYEPFVNGLAEHLVLLLPAWYPEPGQIDNWVRSPRGRSAQRLMEAVPAQPEEAAPEDEGPYA